MRVTDLLKIKGNGVMMIGPTETIQSVANRLHQEGVGAMIVSGDGESLKGIITERDIVIGLAVHGSELHSLPASALMSTAPIICSPETSITEVAKIMTLRRLRHLPVNEGKRLVGVISIGDVLKHRLEEVQLESGVLRDIAIAGR